MLQVDTGVSLNMLLTAYETDILQKGVCTGTIVSCYSFAQTEKKTLPQAVCLMVPHSLKRHG